MLGVAEGRTAFPLVVVEGGRRVRCAEALVVGSCLPRRCRFRRHRSSVVADGDSGLPLRVLSVWCVLDSRELSSQIKYECANDDGEEELDCTMSLGSHGAFLYGYGWMAAAPEHTTAWLNHMDITQRASQHCTAKSTKSQGVFGWLSLKCGEIIRTWWGGRGRDPLGEMRVLQFKSGTANTYKGFAHEHLAQMGQTCIVR